ncbi:MAG: cysteine desulfurase family protein [bacterium]
MQNIYFDHAAAAPPAPEVLEAMLPFFQEHFGNPASLHEGGKVPNSAVKNSREQIANFTGGTPEEIFFTSGGTESNNLLIKGIARARQKKGRHIITSSVDHYSVHHPCKTLSKEGFEITMLPVDRFGTVDPESVKAAIRDDTILISLMLANNEVGTVQPVAEISETAREKGITMHTDAVMALGRIPVSVEELGVDALSFSACQFYGPLGAGGFYLKKGTRCLPLIEGGTQQSGKRAGTENVPGIVGMGKAAELAAGRLDADIKKLTGMQKRLWEELPRRIPDILLTGHPEKRIPGHVSLCVEFIEGEGMLLFLMMEGFSVASGSACTSLALKSSYVLEAMKVPTAIAQGSLVVTLGRGNTMEEIDKFLETLPPIIQRLREMSPLYNK